MLSSNRTSLTAYMQSENIGAVNVIMILLLKLISQSTVSCWFDWEVNEVPLPPGQGPSFCLPRREGPNPLIRLVNDILKVYVRDVKKVQKTGLCAVGKVS